MMFNVCEDGDIKNFKLLFVFKHLNLELNLQLKLLINIKLTLFSYFNYF